MPSRSAICLVLDRLQAGMMGAYGNAWVRTPNIDRLACESFLFDQALADSPQLDSLYRSFWRGVAAADPPDARGMPLSLAALARQAGVEPLLLTEDPLVASQPGADDFARREVLDWPDVLTLKRQPADTRLARFFAVAGELVRSAPPGSLVWVHCRALSAPWDAPYSLREQYGEPDDPPPPHSVEVPCRVLKADYDPDELLGISHSYAAQVSLLDECLGDWLDSMAAVMERDTLLAVIGARGFPLGEHLRVGPCDEPLYNETVHVPWLVRLPNGCGAMERSQALVQPADLPGTLLDWLQNEPGGDERPMSLLPLVLGRADRLRDYVLLRSQLDQAVRTAAWHLRRARVDGDERLELYAKPSDRWEVNDVSGRCSEVAAELVDLLRAGLDRPPEQRPAQLAESLVTIVD